MANGKLIAIKLERFKSYEKPTAVELKPLTIVIGPNNSGKSTLIQALLLLKQTLTYAESNVPIRLTGEVKALGLGELTSGWPYGQQYDGPSIQLDWTSETPSTSGVTHATRMTLEYSQTGKSPNLKSIKLCQAPIGLARFLQYTHLHELFPESKGSFEFRRNADGVFECYFENSKTEHLLVELDHFLPYIQLDTRKRVAPRHRARDQANFFNQHFATPLQDLGELLRGLFFLGSTRDEPPNPHPANQAPEDLGARGQFAADMLYAHQGDLVHYLPPIIVDDDSIARAPTTVRAQPLAKAVNEVFTALGVETEISIEDIRGYGFRLLFGSASLAHVGRGINHLLPIVELGLITDPLRFDTSFGDGPVDDYLAHCTKTAHCAIEEIESHLHPRVQSRLAHWLVSLARSGRRLIVETHSDHLVRRLRGLVARTEPGSELETWLLTNVAIVEVEQDETLRSTLRSSPLTRDGGIEHWPSGFMDEATNEERAIYIAALDKPQEPAAAPPTVTVEHDPAQEPRE